MTDIVVKPSEWSNFIAAAKEQVTVFSKYKFAYSWTASSSSEKHFYFGVPIKDIADIANLFNAINDVKKKGGEEYKAMENKFKGTYEYLRRGIYTYTPKLSVLTESLETSEDEKNFVFWGVQYVKPGWTNEYEAVIKEFVALAKKKNVSQNFKFIAIFKA